MKDSKEKLTERFKVNEIIPIQIKKEKGKTTGKTFDGITCVFNNSSKLKPNSIIDCKISKVNEVTLTVQEIKKPLSDVHHIGDLMQIKIEDGKKGNPIAKTKDGAICFFDQKDTIKPQIGSVSDCEITEVKEKVLILRVVKVVTTASQRATDGLDALVNKYKKH